MTPAALTLATNDPCPHCATLVREARTSCVACGIHIGFPNVRLSGEPVEREALDRRYKSARRSAAKAGAEKVVEAFIDQLGESRVVIARRISILDSLTQSDDYLLVPFHRQVASGQRDVRDVWDKYRTAAESTVNPVFFGEIIFGALSLDGKGDEYYGEFSITLAEKYIAHRTSFFHENPFQFHQNLKVIAGTPIPAGYRATWEERSKLATAKHWKQLKDPSPSFPEILLEQSGPDGDGDFVEAHIYGVLHRSAIEHVRARTPSNDVDRAVWNAVKERLTSLGIPYEEV